MSLVYSNPGVARDQIIVAAITSVQRRRRATLVASAQWSRCENSDPDDLFGFPSSSVLRGSDRRRLVLSEVAPFLEQLLLLPDEYAGYMEPQVSDEKAIS